MLEHDELLPVFVEESQNHLQSIEPDLLALEQSGKTVDPELVNRIFRSIHSIKGASGFFGFQNIGNLSHVMENTLALLRDGKIKPSTKLIDGLLSGVDALRAMVEDVTGSEQFNIAHEVAYLKKVLDEADRKERVIRIIDPDGNPSKTVEFKILEDDLRYFISKNMKLYAVKIFLNQDLRKRNKSPFDLIYNMESIGQYVDSFLDIHNITGLSDCLDNDLAFDFLFTTFLEITTVCQILDLPRERIRLLDLSEFEKEFSKESPPIPADSKIEEKAVSLPEKNDDKPLEESPEIEDTIIAHETHEEIDPNQDEPEEHRNVSDKEIQRIQTEEKIRVGVNFLNDLVNLAGELVLGRNQLLQIAMPLTKTTPGLNPVLQHINRIASEMQEKIMQMRMQPIALIFNKFHRLVRSLAKNHNKEVKLFTTGGEVELDKTIIEGLSDPLTHLIRNAVDHGIEPPEAREKSGKPRLGAITLKAYHQGGQVLLEISDDGKGIDPHRVGKKAIEKGLINTEQLNSMTEKELIRIIFQPGFSTAEQVTDLSGRGVGMDVVLTNIEHLGGVVDIDTKSGKGTRVTLILPLTLAIISGLLVKADRQLFILPEADIDELVRVKPNEIQDRINLVHDAQVLRLREMLLPLVNLTEVLGLAKNNCFLEGRTEPVRILVAKYGASRFGLIVDSIESTEEIVVKPLPRYLKKMKTFSGVSILGNGTVSLILDVAGIVKKANIRQIDTGDETLTKTDAYGESEIQTFLLFDNNTKERFALPLELISRIERVPASGIEQIKDKSFIQYHGKKLRLVFLEDYLPISKPVRSESDTIGVIVPKQIKHPMGIVFNKVINTVSTVVDLDTTSIMAPGLFGSTVMDGKITLLPDMYRLFEMAAPEWYKTEKIGKTDANRKQRVLLVDDTPFFRMVEKDYLSSAGYEVLTAENGKSAIELLAAETVDGIILDIIMPKMDGWDVIRAIRADDRIKHIPVMAVTSVSDEASERKGLEAGFDEWELKLDKVRLLDKLSRMIRSKKGKG